MCNIARATVECIPNVHSSELLDMRYARIALLATVATTLLPLATPAVADLGHPTGCFMCSPVEVTAAPPGATALAPEATDTATANIPHVRHHARRVEVHHLGSF